MMARVSEGFKGLSTDKLGKEASGAKSQAQEDCKEIAVLKDKAESFDAYLQTVAHRSTKILEKCETALASSTSAGLARSFNDRKKELPSLSPRKRYVP